MRLAVIVPAGLVLTALIDLITRRHDKRDGNTAANDQPTRGTP